MNCNKTRITAPRALAAIGFVVFLASACQPTVTEAPVQIPSSETVRDAALSKSVRDRLLAIKAADLSAIKVVSSSGTVYLSGTVASLNARQEAVKTAWAVPGVQSVVNALEVQK